MKHREEKRSVLDVEALEDRAVPVLIGLVYIPGAAPPAPQASIRPGVITQVQQDAVAAVTQRSDALAIAAHNYLLLTGFFTR